MKKIIVIFFAILFISLLAISGVNASEISGDVNNGIYSDICATNINAVTSDVTNDAISQTNNADICEDTNINDDIEKNEKTASRDMIETSDNLSSTKTDLLNTDEKTFTELQENIHSASSAPITLENDYIYTDGDSALQDGIEINGKTVTINGKGHTIDGNGQARIFNVINGGQLILKNIRLNNGNHTYGGAIRLQYDSTATLINCTLTNSTSDNGGAIWLQGSLTVSNSTFINNIADFGGAIYDIGNMNVTSSIFMQNAANTNNGGAIYAGIGTVTNSTFIQNGVGYYSGIYNSYGNLIIKNNTLVDDTIYGGNESDYENVRYLGSFTSLNKIINTTEYDIRLTKDYIYTDPDYNFKNGINITTFRFIDGNGHTINGNGQARIFIVNESGRLSLRNITLFNAHCDENGGAISTNGNLTITNSTFLQNNANGNGGAIYANASNVSITNALFNKNKASQGDSIYLVQGTAHINGSTLIDDDYYSESEGTINLDNIKFLGSFIALNNQIISSPENSEITLDRDYIFTESDSEFKYGINITKSITIDGNGHTINANRNFGIFDVMEGVTLILRNLNFINTKSIAISMSKDANLTVLNTIFKNCTSSNGGAIYCGSNSTLDIINSTFTQNTGITGGAIDCGSNSTVNIINSTFTQNNAGTTSSGGVIYSSSTLNLINCSFNDNKAGSKGGVLYTNNKVNITACNFTNNTAPEGGAIYIHFKGTVNIMNSSFTQNNAEEDGGAIYNNGTLDIINSTLENNQAKLGGAIYQDRNNTILNNCTFNNNKADSAGAIAIWVGRLNMTNCTFYKNNGLESDAVYIINSARLSNIHKCTFIYDTVGFGSDTLNLSDSRFVKTFQELNLTINKISNSTINLKYDYRCDDSESNFFNGITINRKVTIYGNGHTIDGNGLARIFNVNNGEVVFQDINFINGYPCFENPANGGAIKGQCTAINCTFTNNQADVGGAMFEGTAILCIFENNSCYNTVFPTLNVSDFTSTYNSGDKLLFHLTYANQEFDGVEATINVTQLNDNPVGIYHALTGNNNGWVVDLPVGVYKATLSCDKYPEINPVISTLTIKYKTNFTIESIENSTTNQKILINVTESNGFNGTVTVKIGVDEYNITLENGEGTNETTITIPGIYTITLHFDESGNFTEADTSAQFTVKYPTNFAINEINNITTDQTIIITVNEEYGYDGLVDMILESEGYTTTTSLILNEGVGITQPLVLPQGTYKAKIIFSGTGLYNATSTESNLFTIKYPTRFIIAIDNGTADRPINIVVNEENNYTGEITLTIDNNPYIILLENGAGTNNAIKVKTGTYIATINFDGDNVYNATNAESNEFIVKLADPELDINVGDVVEGNPISVKVNAINTFNRLVEVKIVGNTNTSVNIMVNNGVGIGTLLLPAGEYIASICFEGNDEFNGENSNTTFHVKSVIPDSEIKIPSLDNPSSDGTVTVTLPADASGTITLSIGGKNYDFPVVNGVSKVKIPENLNGDYTLTYSGDGKYSSFAKIGYLKAKTKIMASSVTATYNANKYLVITLKDISGKVIGGVKLSVNLNGVKTLTTDKNGQIKVSTKGLAPNTYTAKVTFNGNSKYIGSSANVKVTIKKATPKLTAKAKTFRVKVKTKKYSITLKNNLGKVMKNTKVTLKVNKKTFKATTNSKGVATFKITNLKKKGKYTAVVTYAGSKYYNKATKKPKITIKA